MLVEKITVGFVTQTFCTKTNKYVSQKFVASDQVDYERDGEAVDSKLMEVNGKEPYLPFDMVQPDAPSAYQQVVKELAADCEENFSFLEIALDCLREEVMEERHC